MTLRSYYIFSAGVPTPKDFGLRGTPTLLTFGELWPEARTTLAPSLVFRVRSERDPGDVIAPTDRLESCCGILDSASRWRSCFAMARGLAVGVSAPAVSESLGRALGFLAGRHPATISAADRTAIVGDIEKSFSEEAAAFDVEIAKGIARLVYADNEFEAARLLPFIDAMTLGVARESSAYGDRITSIEVLASAVLMSEIAGRLSERMPGWWYATMPEIEADKEKPPAGKKPAAKVREEEEDDAC